MTDKKQEELENVEENGSTRGTGESGSNDTYGREERPERGSNGTGEGTGKAGNENGTSGEGNGKPETGSKGSREGDKSSLLERIRNKRNKGNPKPSNDEHSPAEGEIQGNGRNDDQPIEGVILSSGTGRGQGGRTGRQDGEAGGSNSDAGSSGESSNDGRVRPRGVEVSLPPLPPPSKDSTKPITTGDKKEDVLTKKESAEIKARIEDALTVIFKYADKGIGMTTKNPDARNVIIWSSIEKDEISIIATFLVERGQKNRMVASVSRRIARDYQLLQLQIITLPRFYMTYQHYMENGFLLPFGEKK